MDGAGTTRNSGWLDGRTLGAVILAGMLVVAVVPQAVSATTICHDNPLGNNEICIDLGVVIAYGAIIEEVPGGTPSGDVLAVVGDVTLTNPTGGTAPAVGAGLSNPCEPYNPVPGFQCQNDDPISFLGDHSINQPDPSPDHALACLRVATYRIDVDQDDEYEINQPGYFVEPSPWWGCGS